MKKILDKSELKAIVGGPTAVEYAVMLALAETIPHVQIGNFILALDVPDKELIIINTNTGNFKVFQL